MKTNSIRAFVCAGFLALTSSSFAASFITEITGTGAPFEVQVNWSTNIGIGNSVTVGDLTDLSYFLYENDVLVYTDVVIVEGEIQDIGGVSRISTDLRFEAISGQSISYIDNDKPVIQEGNASGLTYNIYGQTNGQIVIEAYFDGYYGDSFALSDVSQNTVSAIPEPGASACLTAGASLLVALSVRKRRTTRS